jgi:hypothetical protein
MSPRHCTLCRESSAEVAATRGGAFDDADAELRRLIREGLELGRYSQVARTPATAGSFKVNAAKIAVLPAAPRAATLRSRALTWKPTASAK